MTPRADRLDLERRTDARRDARRRAPAGRGVVLRGLLAVFLAASPLADALGADAAASLPDRVGAWLRQPAAFPFLFILAWLAVGALLSWIGGWHALASAFPDPGRVEGRRFRLVSGFVGRGLRSARYRSVLAIVVGERGLRVSILLPFRFMHPPFFVPWTEIASVDRESRLLESRIQVRLRRHWSGLMLAGAAGEAVLDAWYGRSGRARG